MVSERVLERVRWLRGLSRAARRELAARSVLHHLAANEVLWRQRDAPRGVVVILSGAVRVVRGSGGRQYVLHREASGGTLGEVPFFSGGGYPATAIAEGPTECLILTRGAVEAAIAVEPAVAWLLLERLADRVRELVRRLERVTVQPVQTRLAVYLLTRQLQSGSAEFTLGQSQERLAEDLGTVREVIVRELRKLIESGVIQRQPGGRYAVERRSRLEILAAPAG